jgi:cytoskeletal protein RodZ
MDFLQLGQYLQDTRTNSERTLQEAASATRIRQSTLEAFEMGDFASLNEDPIRVRGFLRIYADWLELDPDRVVAYYEEASHPSDKRRGRNKKSDKQPIAPRRITDTPLSLPAVTFADDRSQGGRNLLLTLLLLIISAGAIVVIAFVTVEIVRAPDDEFVAVPTSATRSVVGVLPPTATYTPSWTPRPAVATSTVTPIFVGTGIVVEVNVLQRTFMRVIVDGGEQFNGVVPPNETLRYEALNSVNILAGNAAALDIVYNGVPQNTFGVRGQRVELSFTPNDVSVITGPGLQPTPVSSPTPLPSPTSIAATVVLALTPTEGPSPTPTLTSTVTNTPLPTPTLPLSPTPTQSPTTTPIPSDTPPPSPTPSVTVTPTQTLTPSPTPILPPRLTPTGLPPTKTGA